LTGEEFIMTLATLGYEGLNIETFFNILKDHSIETIVDIRELPISRKPGFSKNALIKHAESFGLQYVHLRDFGAPRAIRHQYRADDDWDKFTDEYLTHLKLQKASLVSLLDLVQHQNCCLLCFETNHLRCHRRYVANALFSRTDGQLEIKHLAAKEIITAAWLQPLVGITVPQ
jgi:uncharacterized protein (DUF488 family)